MSDTVIFKRFLITGAFKSVMMYGGISACLGVGMAFMDMSKDKWDALWWMQKAGWAILLIGNTLNTIKAATSNSTRKES
jgi:hypothetical protein